MSTSTVTTYFALLILLNCADAVLTGWLIGMNYTDEANPILKALGPGVLNILAVKAIVSVAAGAVLQFLRQSASSVSALTGMFLVAATYIYVVIVGAELALLLLTLKDHLCVCM